MKTTVELPDDLLRDTRKYASERGKTFREVLTQALDLLIYDSDRNPIRPGWESLFGAFAGDMDNQRIQEFIDSEFSRIDREEWK
ncbi:MAG: hypothetical protein P4L46_21815 [Fimbriimonas sp.]|nr:hypothetical protein [Fimbriimonas sp.]